MPYERCLVVQCLLACLMLARPAVVDAAQSPAGRIEGRIVRADETGVEGATILLVDPPSTTTTGRDGQFSFTAVPPGTYTLTISLGKNVLTLGNVSVSAAATTTIDETVDWDIGFNEALTVVPSRRVERIVEAPASVSRLTAAEISEHASHGQLPKLLEYLPGAQLTQSGVYDSNFNTRGFNSSLNRRVAVLVDGRDPAAAFFGAQEWAAVGFPLDDLASAELVRGPSAAMYGANASSGILNLITKEPRFNQGGIARATFGQLATTNVDFRWAGALGSRWFIKGVGGLRNSGDFSVSRRGAAEYSVPCPPNTAGNCLPQEVVDPPRLDDNEVYFGGIRVDKYFDAGPVVTMEGGTSSVAGPIIQTGVGRTQVTEVRRPWARANLKAAHLDLLAAYTGRDAPGQLALASGTNSTLTSHTFQFEGQVDRAFADTRVQVLAGGSAFVEDINSFDEGRQAQSLMFEPIRSNHQAVFGQVDWAVSKSVRLVVAGRGDFSSLHEFQFSPKGSIVYEIRPGHSVRLTYNEGFQVPNHSEFFLQADAAPPANLTNLNAFCTPFGVDCGFGLTRVLAVGNRDLELEEMRTVEAGYKGLIARRGLLTLDYHRSRASNFITDLLPQLSATLGRINPNYGPWQAPAGLPALVAAQIRAAVPTLSNNFDGSNILAVVSYTNFGRVDTQGVDLGFNYSLPAGWRAAFAYSWFDFNVKDSVPGFEQMVLPNSPEHSFSLGTGIVRRRFDADFAFRWVDTFRWAVGSFQGDVEAYTTADLTANYKLTPNVTLGLNIANVFDDRHWESFGGDILRRRALVSVGYLW